ncbi:MAG: class I SAM-dependent methyltransferase [bacterium]
MSDSESVEIGQYGENATPFDALSKDYDRNFTHTTLGRWLRAQVWQRLAANFAPGEHILEIGCGTGEDALWLGQRGIRVTATDGSLAMLHIARQKIAQRNLAHLIQTTHLDFNQPETRFDSQFDGIFANFGVLNCVKNRNCLAQTLSGWMRSRGRAIFVLMNPYCPWEILWHLGHRELSKSFRRIGQDGVSAPLPGGSKIQIWYPSPKQLISEFQPNFRFIRLQGLGIFLPPSYLKHLVNKHPKVFRNLYNIENKLAARFPWNWLNDHYILELMRK